MPARERGRLTDAAIARLRPRAREYTVWDRAAPGLGVRVRPTGGTSWVMLEDAGGRSRRVSLGPVSTMTVAEARRVCLARRVNPETGKPAGPARTAPLFREFVEGDWREARFERCKPATRKSYSSLLRGRLLPAFGAQPLDRIGPTEVRLWFDDFSRAAPGNANNALKLLRQILNFAIARGHLQSNPARDIRPNRRPRLTRFLSTEEIARLHRVLDGHAGAGGRAQADIIRLLLLTGCRRNEIVRLRWVEVRGDTLVMADSKTGPRKVPLNSQARAILERQPRGESPFVFPSPLDPLAAARAPPRALVPGPAGGRHRGRQAARSQAHSCQPRGDERRAGPGGLPPARSFQHTHDAPIRPSRRPRHRTGRRTSRTSHGGADGTGHSTAPVGCVERRLVRVTHPFHPLHGRAFSLVEIKPTMGMKFVHYTGDDGVLRSIQRGWTSVACEDPFVRVGVNYALKPRHDRLRERGLLTALEVADRFGVSDTTVYRWHGAGLLRAHAYSDRPRYLYEILDPPPTEQPRPKQGPSPDPAGQRSIEVQYGT